MPSASSPDQPTTHPDIPPFPSPATFAILPDIYLLIARLSILQVQPNTAAEPVTAAAASSAPSSHYLVTGPPLEPKDLPSYVYPIKQKIAKARAAVQALPDVERSVRDQEREIALLERRVESLTGRLAKLGAIAGESEVKAEPGGTRTEQDVVMQGVDG